MVTSLTLHTTSLFLSKFYYITISFFFLLYWQILIITLCYNSVATLENLSQIEISLDFIFLILREAFILQIK